MLNDGVMTISTEIGNLNVRVDVVTCEGPGCPAELIDIAKTTLAEDHDWVDETAIEPILAVAKEDSAAAAENIEVASREDGGADGSVMLPDVMFDFDKATLAPEGIKALARIAEKIPYVEGLEIVGHTDSRGSDVYNMQLGQARADMVLEWLEAHGHIDKGTVVAWSAGESTPIAENLQVDGTDNPEGRAMNRRVEFRFVGANAG